MSIQEEDIKARRRAMGAFACMPAGLLSRLYDGLTGSLPTATLVRGPEIGLVMLRGRTGGGGAAFNLGEASVVRATMTLETGEVGHALVLGRDVERARRAAHLDAVWQRPEWRSRIEDAVVSPGLAAEADAARDVAAETEATRVDFFTLVRGED